MSHSPQEADGDPRTYAAGWTAISRLIRQGYSWSGHERNVALLNLGDGTFADVSAISGYGLVDDGRALASVDWDFDGDLDLFQTSRTGPRLRFLENVHGSAGGFLNVRLVGSAPNTDAVGARVLVHLEGEELDEELPLLRTRRVGEGFLAQSSAWLTFGLGGRAVERIDVRWPGGVRETFEGIAAGRSVLLEQESGMTREWNPPSVPELAAAEPPVEPAPRRAARVVLATALPMPRIEAIAPDGRTVPFLGIGPQGPQGTGRPLLLNVWASWCAPCAEELTAFAAAKDKIGARLDVVALSVDEKGAAAAELLERVKFPFTSGRLTPESLEILDTLESAILDREERLSVPTSFLIDGGGRVVAMYVGPVEPDTVLADLGLIGLPDEDRRARAVPFTGRWHYDPPGVDLAYLEAEFRRRGLMRTAGEFALGRFEVRQVTEAKLQLEFGIARIRQERFEVALQHFQSAAELDPYYVEAYSGGAYCLHRLERWREAIEAYDRVLELSPRDDRSLFNRGLVYVELGELEAARRDWARLRAIGSEHARELGKRIGE
ncbi:MAG: tetratricopeptide repeat protein [bacterium]|nr:tetratricopeptide repeat protein [bacterium]